jgi:hypothetical protein
MEIIFDGRFNTSQAVESLEQIIHMFQERYQIRQFREMHLSVTLVDAGGQDVELVDSETAQVYRVFEVRRQAISMRQRMGRPALKLVINNDDI